MVAVFTPQCGSVGSSAGAALLCSWMESDSLFPLGDPHFSGGGSIPQSLLAYLYSFRGGVPGWADLHLLGGPSILPHIPEQILSHLISEWDPSPLNPNPNAPTPPIYTSPRPIHVSPLPHCSLVCLFLKRGADINAVDAEGKDALTIAMELANADIVTL